MVGHARHDIQIRHVSRHPTSTTWSYFIRGKLAIFALVFDFNSWARSICFTALCPAEGARQQLGAKGTMTSSGLIDDPHHLGQKRTEHEMVSRH